MDSTLTMLMLQPQRETDDAMRQRVHGVLEEIWENEAKDKQGMYCDLIQTVLSITCHSGVIQRIFEITSHIPRPLPVGAILPMMIRARKKDIICPNTNELECEHMKPNSSRQDTGSVPTS